MSEWDWENNDISPYSVSSGSAMNCSWKCSICGHSWKAPAYSRGSNGCGCPECAKTNRGKSKSKKSAINNLFITQFPDIAKEWNYQKNTELNINDISSFSNKRVWWKCSVCDHEWETTVKHRTKENTGCPECAKRIRGQTRIALAAQKNNFELNFPEIAKEWHPNKNGNLKPKDFASFSNRKVWWMCTYCNHEWQSTITHRTNGRGCPNCAKCQTSYAEQLIFHYVFNVFPDAINRFKNKNEFEFDIYIPSKKIAIEFDGYFYHKSKEIFEKDNAKDLYCRDKNIKLIRLRSDKLPNTIDAICIKVNENKLDLAIEELFSFFPDITIPNINTSRDLISIRERFGQKPIENSISIKMPLLLTEWHPTKNGNILPESVPLHSNMKLWWKCSVCGYEWQSTPGHRASGRNCPACAGHILIPGKNDLQTMFPNVAEEWNYERNGTLTPSNIANKSNAKVWWKCLNHGHEWQATVSERTRAGRSTGCPYCSNKKVLKGFNDLATTHPKIANQWDYSKNDFTPFEITRGSKKYAWWICEKCGYNWRSVIYSRTRPNSLECPNCSKKHL